MGGHGDRTLHLQLPILVLPWLDVLASPFVLPASFCTSAVAWVLGARSTLEAAASTVRFHARAASSLLELGTTFKSLALFLLFSSQTSNFLNLSAIFGQVA